MGRIKQALLRLFRRKDPGQGLMLRLPAAPIPENAPKLAHAAVEATLHVDGTLLDYSPESLKHVDRIIESLHEEGLAANQVGETIFTFGCYVGEVIVRNLNATWVMPDVEARKVGFDTMCVRMSAGGIWNPIGKAFKLLQNGSEDSVAFLYKVAASDSLTGTLETDPDART